jgi:hypothetical protein
MTKRGCRTRLVPILLGVLVVGGLLMGPQPASAVLTGACGTAGNPACAGPTTTGDVCMQQIFSGGATPTSAQRLNCTANDVRISKAVDVFPTSCLDGSTFTLTATFEINVTANSRYDAGFFFNIAGGDDARDNTGTCSLSTLNKAVLPALDLDGDTCGDLNAGTYQVTFTIPGVQCNDSDGDGLLNLPNCTSWHNKAGTVCTSPTVLPPAPDTRSKCVCDDTFQVPVTVESPSGAVRKTATQAVVTYEVKVKNNSSTQTVKINSLTDDIYGDLTKDKNSGNALIESTDCNNLIGTTIGTSSESNACHFTVKITNTDTVGDGTNGTVANTVTAEIEDTAHVGNTSNVTGNTKVTVDLGPDNTD